LKKEHIIFDYNLKKIKIALINEINDLGITFDLKLNFKIHSKNIINKASAKLELIKHTFNTLRDAYALKL